MNNEKISVDKNIFIKTLKHLDCSIRKLGDDYYNDIQVTEKTIRRHLNKGEMSKELLNKIAKVLNVHPDFLSGEIHNKERKFQNEHIQALLTKHLIPENFPYILSARSQIDYAHYFENILTMNNITMEQFKILPAMERVMFHQEIVLATLKVVSKYFNHDSMGQDLSEKIDYYESSVDDYDPFSYFARLEGIGIYEEDSEPPSPNESSDINNSFKEKYGI